MNENGSICLLEIFRMAETVWRWLKMAFKKAANGCNGSKWLEITVND